MNIEELEKIVVDYTKKQSESEDYNQEEQTELTNIINAVGSFINTHKELEQNYNQALDNNKKLEEHNKTMILSMAEQKFNSGNPVTMNNIEVVEEEETNSNTIDKMIGIEIDPTKI